MEGSGFTSKVTLMSETSLIEESIGDWMMPLLPSPFTPQDR